MPKNKAVYSSFYVVAKILSHSQQLSPQVHNNLNKFISISIFCCVNPKLLNRFSQCSGCMFSLLDLSDRRVGAKKRTNQRNGVLLANRNSSEKPAHPTDWLSDCMDVDMMQLALLQEKKNPWPT